MQAGRVLSIVWLKRQKKIVPVLVLAHAVALGSGYTLGASNGAFLMALGIHHEVQYLSFTYAMARRPRSFYPEGKTGTDLAITALDAKASYREGAAFRTEVEHRSSFLVWPVIGFTGAVAVGGQNSNGSPRWAWAGYYATTSSIAASGRGAVPA